MAEYKAEKIKSDDAPAETKASSDDKKPELALAFDAMDKQKLSLPEANALKLYFNTEEV